MLRRKVDAADETKGHLTVYDGHGRRAVRREGARACTSPGDLRRSNPVRQRAEVTGSIEVQRRCRPVRRLCGAAWIRWRCHALEAGATAMTRPGPRQGAPLSTCSSSGSLFSPSMHLLLHLTSNLSLPSHPPRSLLTGRGPVLTGCGVSPGPWARRNIGGTTE
ncbi:uncharacterized protein SCHCODRAFT_02198696 [Schizophyllum commune H4-8]|uniref:uncharacterized protein n=1 Tax=Schizophyllum commune (strain H4-8 / FGSC 9210) TaxID=578458 RepID=UPI00215DE705|nr:uncharacterized protein SCHCODRAFT_02198696 [Schizophyllum commune H4-8]KAI5896772.1 hypothetical protein SCHCODRAFT_02198696 [Schizophyllum commune H4-8]